FGTGYSSLSYLKKLPVDELKIDKSFVMNMATDKDDATIVRSTIDLGHNMGLKVVAEGVENEAAWQMLKTWGCDLAQGYYVSAALPPGELVQWLSQLQRTDVIAKR
ncbi:MAG: EAL domain-containing protein, partial [Burkholderiales bacterium]